MNWQAVLDHQIVIPLALPVALGLLALILRFGRTRWYRLKQGGFPPIVIHAADDAGSRALAVRLSEFLAQEEPGPAVIIPPGSGASPMPVPVEQLGVSGNWAAAFIRIVLSREPAFDVYVECPALEITGTGLPGYEAIIRVTRVPGNRVLAADHVHDAHIANVVHAAGCLVASSIRQEPRALRHTPRWERWSPGIEGYSAYRSALDLERLGNSNTAAIEKYDHALSYEPGNFLISVRKAALLEVMGKFEDASQVYRTCNELWPEHIETAYRLAASCVNYGDHDAAEAALKSIRLSLELGKLWKERRKTWQPAHRNIGERRYWRSLCRRHPLIFGSSNRRHLLRAVDVAEQVQEISRIARGETHINSDGKEITVDSLINRMAKLTRRTANSPYQSLFHPELLVPKDSGEEGRVGDKGRPGEQHDSRWHQEKDDKNMAIDPEALSQAPRRFKLKKRMGWLAHYNAACFYSLALSIGGDRLPPCYSSDKEEWEIDCARAAIRELGHVRRDPLSKLKPEWYKNDPELMPLTGYAKAKGIRWAKLVGL